ncbi:hypothetical protein MBANPS3_011427 [Mucor bainieri]
MPLEVFNLETSRALDNHMRRKAAKSLQQLIDLAIGGSSLTNTKEPIKITITKPQRMMEPTYERTLDAAITNELASLPLRPKQSFDLVFAAPYNKRYKDSRSGTHRFEGSSLPGGQAKDVNHARVVPDLLFGRFGSNTLHVKAYIFFPEVYVKNALDNRFNNGSMNVPKQGRNEGADDLHSTFVDKLLIPAINKITSSSNQSRIPSSLRLARISESQHKAYHFLGSEMEKLADTMRCMIADDPHQLGTFANFYFICANFGAKYRFENSAELLQAVNLSMDLTKLDKEALLLDIGFNQQLQSTIPLSVFFRSSRSSGKSTMLQTIERILPSRNAKPVSLCTVYTVAMHQVTCGFKFEPTPRKILGYNIGMRALFPTYNGEFNPEVLSMSKHTRKLNAAVVGFFKW